MSKSLYGYFDELFYWKLNIELGNCREIECRIPRYKQAANLTTDLFIRSIDTFGKDYSNEYA